MVIKIFILKLLRVIIFVFTMSTLLATLMTYSRLSSESELIALQGYGVSVYRIVFTAVIMSFFVAGLTFVVNENIVPAATYEAAITLDKALKSEKPIIIKQNNIFYPEYHQTQKTDGNKNKILTILIYLD